MKSQHTHINNINGTVSDRLRSSAVSGTVSDRLRSSAQHVISVRKNDMIRQRQLRYRFLKAQGMSTFAIVNPECPIRHDKVTNRLRVRGIQ